MEKKNTKLFRASGLSEEERYLRLLVAVKAAKGKIAGLSARESIAMNNFIVALKKERRQRK